MITISSLLGVLALEAPAIVAVICSIIMSIINKSCINGLKTKVDELATEVQSTKEYQDVKAQLTIVQQENVQLKKAINELLTKIDKVVRKDDGENKTM